MDFFLHSPILKNEICRINLVVISQSVHIRWNIMYVVIPTLTFIVLILGSFFLFKMNFHSRHKLLLARSHPGMAPSLMRVHASGPGLHLKPVYLSLHYHIVRLKYSSKGV